MLNANFPLIRAIKVLRNAMGDGGVSFPGKKRYEGVRFNVISVTRGWVGVKFPGKKCYVTLEWPHTGQEEVLSYTCITLPVPVRFRPQIHLQALELICQKKGINSKELDKTLSKIFMDKSDAIPAAAFEILFGMHEYAASSKNRFN